MKVPSTDEVPFFSSFSNDGRNEDREIGRWDTNESS